MMAGGDGDDSGGGGDDIQDGDELIKSLFFSLF